MRPFGRCGNGLVNQLVVNRIIGAIYLVVVQVAQIKYGAADLRWTSALIDQRLVDDLRIWQKTISRKVDFPILAG